MCSYRLIGNNNPLLGKLTGDSLSAARMRRPRRETLVLRSVDRRGFWDVEYKRPSYFASPYLYPFRTNILITSCTSGWYSMLTPRQGFGTVTVMVKISLSLYRSVSPSIGGSLIKHRVSSHSDPFLVTHDGVHVWVSPAFVLVSREKSPVIPRFSFFYSDEYKLLLIINDTSCVFIL